MGEVGSRRRVLVVDDDDGVRRSLRRALEERTCEVVEAADVEDATERLDTERFDLVILDVRLGDESGVEVARFAWQLEPAPEILVLTGGADNAEAFELGQLGVRALLEKPISGADLDAVLARPRTKPPRLEPVVKRLVGHHSVGDAVSMVREVMFDEALALTDGNAAQAAGILGVSRQAVSKRSKGRDSE